MEIDSENLTPPGSPILGYSGLRDSNNGIRATSISQNINDSNSYQINLFTCKGPIRQNETDNFFHPQSLFLRNEVISAIKILCNNQPIRGTNNEDSSSKNVYFFDFPFEITSSTQKSQLKHLVSMCWKRVNSIKNLISSSNTFQKHSSNPMKSALSLREEICSFLNYLTINGSNLEINELNEIFGGFINSLEWTSSIQHFCGSKNGNECNLGEYHLFHLYLEIRWVFLIIYRLDAKIINWVISDLISLAHSQFKSAQNPMVIKTLYNCYCVKEIWAMIKNVLERIRPNSKNFWDYLNENLREFSKATDSIFPLCLISNLAQLSDYEINGNYAPNRLNSSLVSLNSYSDSYRFISELLKSLLLSKNIKLSEVQELVEDLFKYWGFNCELVLVLWNHWFSVLDKGYEIRNMEHYSSASKWMALIKNICENNGDDLYSRTNTTPDPFLNFVRILATGLKNGNSGESGRVKSEILGKITEKVVESLSENGLTRIVTLFLAVAHVSNKSPSELQLFQRLDALLSYSRPSLLLTTLRSRSTLLLLLLSSSLPISSLTSSFLSSLTKTNTFTPPPITKTSNFSPSKEAIFLYLDLIALLPSTAPYEELGQSGLFECELGAWCNSLGSRVGARVLRVVGALFSNWLGERRRETGEMRRIGGVLGEAVEGYLRNCVVNQGVCKNPSHDIEPYATLGVELTYYYNYRTKTESSKSLFDFFTLHPKSCPKVNEAYVELLIHHTAFNEEFVTKVKWAQIWLRLLCLNCSCPIRLSALVLNGEEVSSLMTNEILWERFCVSIISGDVSFSRDDIFNILSPLAECLKLTLERYYDEDGMRVESIVKTGLDSCRLLTVDRIYVKNALISTSVVHQLLEIFGLNFVGKVPWEKMSPTLLKITKKYLSQMFIVTCSSKACRQDAFLQRKLCDMYKFAFLGFVSTEELDDTNPIFPILKHMESLPPSAASLKSDLISSLVPLIKEVNLLRRYLTTISSLFKIRFCDPLLSALPLLLDLCAERTGDLGTLCANLAKNILILFLIRNKDEESVEVSNLVEEWMRRQFSFKSEKVFEFWGQIVKSKRKEGRDFMKRIVLGRLRAHVKSTEAKQGSGVNYIMRRQYKLLEESLAKYQEQSTTTS